MRLPAPLPTGLAPLHPGTHARLDHSDLSAVLYLQGYRETELVLD